MELKAIVEKLDAEWGSFKIENDRRIKQLEANGGKPNPDTEKKIDAHSAEIGKLQAQLDECQKKMQRPGAGGEDEGKQKSEEQLKAFRAFMRKDGLHASAKSLRASVSIGSDPEGGYGVPDSVDSMIIQYETDNTPMRQACNVISVGNENYSQLVNRGGASSGWVDEGEARPETTSPSLAELKPYFGEIYANPAATQKALDDVGFSVESWLADEVGREFSEQENDAFTNGTGIKKPKGILSYTLAATADATRTFGQIEKLHTASAGNFTIEKLIDLVHLMKAGYRTGASMMTTGLALAAIRKLKSGDVYVFQPSMFVGQPSQLLGYPVIENDDMPVPAADANAICDVKGLTVLRDPYTNKPKVHFYSTKRLGGHVVNDRCFKVLRLSA